MKSFINLSLLIVSLILIPQLLLSQEVEVKLGGDTKSDAFVVKNGSDEVLLRMDGDKNLGINSSQPEGIEIKARSFATENIDGDPIMISGGNTYGGNGGSVSILGGFAGGDGQSTGGSVSILGGFSDDAGGSINITSGRRI